MTYLNVPEVAERLRCSDWSVYRLIKSRELLAAKIAGRWLVTEDALAGYVQEKAREANPDAAPPHRRRRRRRAS